MQVNFRIRPFAVCGDCPLCGSLVSKLNSRIVDKPVIRDLKLLSPRQVLSDITESSVQNFTLAILTLPMSL